MATAHEFAALLDTITSTALRERVEDSAICNARDTMREIGRDSFGWDDDSEYWIMAINTAKMCIDCARDFYPELFTTQQESNTMPSHILYTARNTTPHHNESAYWILATRESDGKWHMAFGDYLRSTVQFERDSYRSDYAAKDLRIVRSTDSQAAIDATFAALNS